MVTPDTVGVDEDGKEKKKRECLGFPGDLFEKDNCKAGQLVSNQFTSPPVTDTTVLTSITLPILSG